MADSRLRRGHVSAKNVQKAIDDSGTVDKYATVASLPAASAALEGKIAYVANGASGSPCLAYCTGASWLRVTLGAAVAAS